MSGKCGDVTGILWEARLQVWPAGCLRWGVIRKRVYLQPPPWQALTSRFNRLQSSLTLADLHNCKFIMALPLVHISLFVIPWTNTRRHTKKMFKVVPLYLILAPMCSYAMLITYCLSFSASTSPDTSSSVQLKLHQFSSPSLQTQPYSHTNHTPTVTLVYSKWFIFWICIIMEHNEIKIKKNTFWILL